MSGGELGVRKCCWLPVEILRVVLKTKGVFYDKENNFSKRKNRVLFN